MAKTAQEYIDELWAKSQQQAGQLYDQRKQSDGETIKQIGEAIDRYTAASTKPYQTQLEQLPQQYQKLYDANAVQELVGRRQVQEAMANMGLTDSGLNRTQQTALSVQKGNADANVRIAQQQKTQELQDKISQLIESGAAQKQQQEASVRGTSSDWYNSLLANYYSDAQQRGTALYDAEQERLYQAAEAEKQRKAALEQAQLKAAAEEAQAQAKAKQQEFENQMKIAALMQKAGASETEINNYLNKYSSGTGGAIYADTENTQKFRGSLMTKNEFSRRSAAKSKYGNYNDYVKTFLTQWYNQNKLSDAEFAFLLDYYGF